MAQIFAHELTHTIESANAYKGLSSAVFARMQQLGRNVDAERQKVIELYRKAGVELTEEGANQELVAKFIESNLLTDEASIYDLVQRNPTIGRRILNWIDSVLARLGSKNARERQFLGRARSLYVSALRQTDGLDQASRFGMARNRLQDDLTAGRLTEQEFEEAMDALLDTESMEGEGLLEQFSIANTRNMPWREQVEKYFKKDGSIKSSDSLYVGESNTTGVKNAPRYVPTSVITKAIRPPKGSRSAHSLSETNILDLEDGINNAPAVIFNPSRNALVYVTENRNAAKEPIVASFDLNNDLVGENAHKCTSIHGRTNVAALLEGLGSDSTVFVKNENKLNQLLPGNQILESLELLAKVEFVDDSVLQNNSSVNEQFSIERQGLDSNQIANDLRQMLNRGASTAELRRYVDGISGGRQQTAVSRNVTPAERIVRTAHRQGLSVHEYLQQNWELYDVDGELNEDARKALELERRRQYSIGEAETAEGTEEQKQSAVDTLPGKAKSYLDKAERTLTNSLSNALGVPWYAKREFLRPVVREISEEYLKTGHITRKTENRLLETAYYIPIIKKQMR